LIIADRDQVYFDNCRQRSSWPTTQEISRCSKVKSWMHDTAVTCIPLR